MNIKKQIKYMLLGVIIFWLIVIIFILIRKTISRRTSDNLGEIEIKNEVHTEYVDPYSSVEGVSLIDTGYVIIYDNDNNLSQKGFITLKGHIYLPDNLTQYLKSQGYENIETITVIPSTCASDTSHSEFIASIDDSDKFIKVNQNYATEEFTFEILDNL